MSIDKENNLLNKKVVYDLTPFTHLDYPNHLSCIVWIAGCGLRCDYCYNKDIVFAKNGKMSFNDILSFLDTRINLLDGVVLSGGEATRVDLISFCKEIKKRNFKIKLDTNGVNFKHIKRLIDLQLINFIALDYKAPKYKFTQITKAPISKFDTFEQTLDYLIKIDFNFEIRTTAHSNLLDENDINFIIDDLIKKGYQRDYFIQNYLDTKNTVGNIAKQILLLDLDTIQSNIINIQYRNF